MLLRYIIALFVSVYCYTPGTSVMLPIGLQMHNNMLYSVCLFIADPLVWGDASISILVIYSLDASARYRTQLSIPETLSGSLTCLVDSTYTWYLGFQFCPNHC